MRIQEKLDRLEKKIEEKNDKIDRLTKEVECMTLAFIEHYNLNKIMVHTKEVKMKSAEEKKEQLMKKIP
tara:strand:+ start:1145 stop:1351 length:207 start_codon:yes stop_codon:yes gene_type:complete